MHRDTRPYLTPYLTAARTHGGGFGSLLWASPTTQASRFDAIARIHSPVRQSVLDVGCGRADFLDFCRAWRLTPNDYIGIEAVPQLADAARAKQLPNCRIIRADFVERPLAMFVAADMIVFSGSLNTLDDAAFYATLQRAFDATADVIVFNFLSSSHLAAAAYLHWRRVVDVLEFARSLSDDITLLDDYLEGDATIAIRKEH
jgi:trans-aconitate methyltransferase